MRIPLIAGNWKMHTTVDEAVALVQAMRPRLEAVRGVEQVVCPPFVSLDAVHRLLEASPVLVGAQDVFWEEKGAYTGAISPLMLAPLCRYVIVGHSERRQYFGVTDEIVNRQIRAMIPHRLAPILCVGETLSENEAGLTEIVVERQVRGGLAGITACPGLVVAYEPVWAIGTGRPSTGEGANRVIGYIRRVLADLLGEAVAGTTRILYGGSVTGANIAEFVSQEEIDGALVGGASLRPDEFIAIVETTAVCKGTSA
ncbi:MAG TPA: triose-phosphate isomerase [Chloroflexota bacterium]|jgi:triosephosphate isomerase|nr:triose-phosphate isomerase [Chloroflexota bacterium]